MTIVANHFDPLDAYPEQLELLRLRALFALRAQERAFHDDGSWKQGFRNFGTGQRSDMEERYAELEQQQRLPIPATGPLSHNIATLRQLLTLTDADCCLLVTLAFTEQDPVLAKLLESGIPAVNLLSFVRCCATLSGLAPAQVERCLGPGGSMVFNTLLRVDWVNRAPFDELWQSLEGIASALFQEYDDMRACLHVYLGAPFPESPLDGNDFSHVAADLAILTACLSGAVKQGTPGCNVLIHGPAGVGKTELARTIAAHVQARAYQIPAVARWGAPVEPAERLRHYRLAQRLLSYPAHQLLLIDNADDIFGLVSSDEGESLQEARRSQKAPMTTLLETNPVPAIWITSSTLGMPSALLHRFDVVLRLDTPPMQQLGKMLALNGTASRIPGEVADKLVAQPCVSPALLERIKRITALTHETAPAIPAEQLARTRIRSHIEAAGMQSQPAGVRALAYDIKSTTSDYDLAAIVEGLRQGGGARICLYGPPGTGKTAFASHMAQALGKKLQVAPVSALLSRYIGETEKAIAKVFATAARANAILLLDEVDSLLTDRTGATRSWEVSQVNELLFQMEQFDGVLMAATNQFDLLDMAVMRRFDLKIKFDWLRPDHAEQLLQASLAALQIRAQPESVEQVRNLECLAPGDFALVLRQSRFMPIQTCTEYVARLAQEHSLKTARGRAIGFVAA